MFDRVLIANRGEVAVRVIRACRDLGIETVAVYSTADQDCLHVRLADRAVHVGPPAARESYLNIPSIVAAAVTTRCDAVHPGWGFLAENADFARACVDNDIVFVGPRADSIQIMGDKARAKATLKSAGLPLVPGSDGAVTLPEARRIAGELGYPLLLKASAGGGGRGMRVVAQPDELEQAFQSAAAEALAAFSDNSLYVEKALVDARHVEIQVLGDGRGKALTLGERDCSVQRRHQKVIEEAPSPALNAKLRKEMEDACRRAVERLRYRGAGTIEFLLKDGKFSFIEMNTRLQVEHPVTEVLTRIDLVKAQLRVAADGALPRTGSAELRGHAIEIRINAEDPARSFLPAPGLVERFRAPLGPGVRVDTHVYEGYRIPPNYDSLLAKVIVWDDDRPGAVARGLGALSELELAGVPTTRELAIDILGDDEFRSGRYTTGYLAEAESRLPSLAPAAA
jgi:acetyl-CoA carboxylase biotin carboxylase subunit